VPSELQWLSRQIRPLLHWQLASFLCITAGSLLALLTPLVLKWLIDQIIPQRKLGLLLLAVGLIFLGYQGRTALTSLGSYLMLTAAQKAHAHVEDEPTWMPRYALSRILRRHAGR